MANKKICQLAARELKVNRSPSAGKLLGGPCKKTVVVDFPELKRKGTELNYFDILPNLGMHYQQTEKRKPLIMQEITGVPLLRPAFHRPNNKIVKSTKEIETLHELPRKEPVADTLGMKPTTGYGRHQKKGLAYDKVYMTGGPLMPQSHSQNATRNNRLGQPKG